MVNLDRRAREVLTKQMDPYVEEFGSMVADVVYDTFSDDAQLRRLATIVAETHYAVEERHALIGTVSKEYSELDEASQKLRWMLERRAEEVVAEKCALVAMEAAEWTDHHSEEKLEAAVREAVEWLQANTTAAERAGVECGEELPDPDELFEGSSESGGVHR